MSQAPTAAPMSIADAAASLQSGQAFTCVLAADPVQRSEALEAVIDSVADMRTRFARVGNPLRSPLTIERLLIQAVGGDTETYYDRDAPTLTRILAGPQGDETRVVLVVEQAETLAPDAMATLREMSASFTAAVPSVQVLFAGHPSFQGVLEGGTIRVAPQAAPPLTAPSLAALPQPAPPRGAEAAPVPAKAAPSLPAPEPARDAARPAPAPIPPKPRRRGWVALVVVLVLLLAVGAAVTVAWYLRPELFPWPNPVETVLRKLRT